jgi:hypothetical protein
MARVAAQAWRRWTSSPTARRKAGSNPRDREKPTYVNPGNRIFGNNEVDT